MSIMAERSLPMTTHSQPGGTSPAGPSSRSPRVPAASGRRGPDEPLLPDAFPEWFGRLPLDVLRLPERLGTVLAPYGTVDAIAGLPTYAVLTHPGLNRGAVERLRKRAAEAFARLSAKRQKEKARSEPIAVPRPYDPVVPLVDHFARNLDVLSDRHARIVSANMGISGPRMTLSALGQEMGVTRERARMLMEQGLRRLDGATGYRAAVTDALAPFSEEVTPMAEVLASTWASGLPGPLAESMLEDLAGLREVDLSPGPVVACSMKPSTWATYAAALRDLVAGASASDTHSDVLAEFEDLLEEAGIEARTPLALARLFLGEGDGVALKLRHGMTREAVMAILAGAPGPMGAAEVLARLGEGSGRDHLRIESIESMEAFLRRAPFAAGVGNGTFVAARAGGGAAAVAEACAAVMAGSPPSRRWGTRELLTALEARRFRVADGLDAHALEAILQGTGRLHRVRSMVWRLAEGDGLPANAEEVAERILAEAGGPMGTGILVARTREVWGRADIQLRPVGRLAILGHGLWGLSDRDIRVAPEARAGIVSRALARLAGGEDSLPALFEADRDACIAAGVDSHHLLGTLLRLDADVGIGRGGRLRMPGKAPEPADGSLLAAAVDLLRASAAPVSLEALCEAVEARCGRPASRATVRKALHHYGCQVSRGKKGVPGLWTAKDA